MNRSRHFQATKWLIAACVIGLLVPSTVVADVPMRINYQGYLTDNTGTPLEGSQLVDFHLYTVDTGGTPLWTEQQTVEVADGVFNVQLGAEVPFVVSDFGTADVYLEVAVFAAGSGWETLSPRQKLTSAAFAVHAADADTLAGYDASAFAEAGHHHDTAYVNEGQADAVTSGMIQDNAITALDLAAGSVTGSEIAAGAVGTGQLATGAVGSEQIADGSVLAADLAAAYVNEAGDSMTGNLSIGAHLEVADTSASSTDYVATFESSGGSSGTSAT